MSVLTMYPVQSMRKFVCDRLTVAAQEILGAFEKRAEDYEAELARQRKILDAVFSAEIKSQRAEIQALLNQQQFGNNYGVSRFQTDTVQVKDEHEEINISQEQPQPLKQQEDTTSTVTPTPGLGYSGGQTQPLGTEKRSGPNEDSLSNSKNKDVESGPREGTMSVNEQQSGETKTQNNNTRASPNETPDPISTESCPGLATNSDEAFDDAFLDANYEDILNEIDDNTFALSSMSPEPSLNMSFGDLNVSSNITEQTHLEKAYVESSAELTPTIHTNFTTPTGSSESAQTGMCLGDNKTSTHEGTCEPEASKIQDENPRLSRSIVPNLPQGNLDCRQASRMLTVLTPVYVTPTPTEKVGGQDGRKASISSNSHDMTLIKSAKLTPNEKNRGATSTVNDEQLSMKKDHNSAASTKGSEQTSSQGFIKEVVASANRKQHTSNKKYNDKMPLRESKDPSEKMSNDGKTLTSERKPHKKNRQDGSTSTTDKTLSSARIDAASYLAYRATQNQRSDNDYTAITETTDLEPNTKDFAQNVCDDKAVSTGDILMAKSDNNERTETLSSDEKKPASHSKYKEKSKDRSPVSGSSREPSNEDAQPIEATKKLRDSHGADSEQKRKRKEEDSTSTRRQNERHGEWSPSNQDLDALASNSDDSESSDGEEKEENPYKCDRCGKIMSNFKNYKFHMKSHTVAKTYECGTCGKKFRESWDLNKHLVIHAAEKPYKCDVCGNGFNRRYNLDLHVRVHTGEKPYKCNTCAKSFSSCVNMKKHMRIHTGEKPYTCKECGKEFADSSAFKNHLRVHTGEKPFKCSYCKRKFATRTTLKRHIRTHTGEKPYKCTVCDRNFGHRTDLKGHMRMHTGEKPYKCTTCGEEFSTWSKLNKHKRIHTGEAEDSTE